MLLLGRCSCLAAALEKEGCTLLILFLLRQGKRTGVKEHVRVNRKQNVSRRRIRRLGNNDDEFRRRRRCLVCAIIMMERNAWLFSKPTRRTSAYRFYALPLLINGLTVQGTKREEGREEADDDRRTETPSMVVRRISPKTTRKIRHTMSPNR